MSKPDLSVIIRTLNEEKWLGTTLQSLKNQTIQNIEVVIVDSGSTDKTLEIAKQYKAVIYQIKKEEFTYPYALNYGIERAKAENIGILSGHSVPVSIKWAETGLKHLKKGEIAGVVGFSRSLPDAKLFDKISQFPQIIPYFLKIHANYNFLDNRNSFIKKSLWRKYPFDESLVNGSEDYDWCYYMTKKLSKKIMYDSRCQVMHSHSGIGKKTDLELWWTSWRHETKKIKQRYV